ncbi:MAG TPA: hypothetical protein GXX14_05930 [Clostridiaceae bacterium]|nr:hypothetical protein [Clostridiaceae bacterium]
MVPPKIFQTTRHDMGKLPEEVSFFSITPSNLVMSALKKAEDRDSYILRVYNPTDGPIRGNVHVYSEIRKAYVINLNEERQKEIAVDGGHNVHFDVGSNKIETLELIF